MDKIRVNDYERLVDELVNILTMLDAQHYDFETDIYLYVHEDGTWDLDTYDNPGGNSWRNDDHIFLYRDKPHYEDVQDWETDDVDEIAKELKYLYGIEYREKAWDILDDAGIE